MNIYYNFNGIKSLADARRWLEQTKQPCTLRINGTFYRFYQMRVFEVVQCGYVCADVEVASYDEAVKWVYKQRKAINEYMNA